MTHVEFKKLYDYVTNTWLVIIPSNANVSHIMNSQIDDGFQETFNYVWLTFQLFCFDWYVRFVWWSSRVFCNFRSSHFYAQIDGELVRKALEISLDNNRPKNPLINHWLFHLPNCNFQIICHDFASNYFIMFMSSFQKGKFRKSFSIYCFKKQIRFFDINYTNICFCVFTWFFFGMEQIFYLHVSCKKFLWINWKKLIFQFSFCWIIGIWKFYLVWMVDFF
jgi:hypothetical protein